MANLDPKPETTWARGFCPKCEWDGFVCFIQQTYRNVANNLDLIKIWKAEFACPQCGCEDVGKMED